jgi:hypothetical protein
MAGVRDQLAAIRFLFDAADGRKFRGPGNSNIHTGAGDLGESAGSNGSRLST